MWKAFFLYYIWQTIHLLTAIGKPGVGLVGCKYCAVSGSAWKKSSPFAPENNRMRMLRFDILISLTKGFYFVVIENLDEVDQQHPLALAVVLKDIRNNAVHPLELMLVFVDQQQPEYNWSVPMVNLK